MKHDRIRKLKSETEAKLATAKAGIGHLSVDYLKAALPTMPDDIRAGFISELSQRVEERQKRIEQHPNPPQWVELYIQNRDLEKLMVLSPDAH